MLTSRLILGSAAAVLSLAAAAQAVQQQPGFFAPKADPNLTSPDPAAQPAQAGQAAQAAQPPQAPVMGPAQGVGQAPVRSQASQAAMMGQPAQAAVMGRVPGQPAVTGQAPAAPAAAPAAPAAAPAAQAAAPAQEMSNAAIANDPTRITRWAEQQMDRSEQEAAQAKAQASTAPAPINGAFTGNTNERDR
jgi:hypothetical protein